MALAHSGSFITGSTPSSLFGGDIEHRLVAPASPTAALDTAASLSAQTKIKRRSLGRRVQFDQDVKQHDGLCTRYEILDAIVKRYFVLQKEVSELDVIDLCAKRVDAVRDLHEDLLDILARLEAVASEGITCVPVLPKGGGMCTKLCTPHVPYIKILDRVVEAAAQRLMRDA